MSFLFWRIKMKKLKETKHFIMDKPKEIGLVFIAKYIITYIQSIYYRILINTIATRDIKKKKYFLSICGIFKNEAPYIKEWIEYHKLVGVDHIYLYNNNSTDEFHKIIVPYIANGFVDLIEWKYEHMQMEAYHNCFNRFRNESNWIGFIDLDEFIVPVEYSNVKDFFLKFSNRPSVLIYWKIFGSNKLIHRDLKQLVIQDFTSCWYKYDDIGKCFINTEYDISSKQKMIHHMLWTKCGKFNFPPVNCCDKVCPRDWFNQADREVFPIQINHYVLKSYDEYMAKVNKTDVMFKENPKGETHFKKHEALCTSKDYTIQKYIKSLRTAIDIDNINQNT